MTVKSFLLTGIMVMLGVMTSYFMAGGYELMSLVTFFLILLTVMLSTSGKEIL